MKLVGLFCFHVPTFGQARFEVHTPSIQECKSSKRQEVVIGSPHAFKFVDYVCGNERRQVPLSRECPQCTKFYDVVLPFIEHVDFEKKVRHLAKCSCRYSHYLRLNTPERFWDFCFPNEMDKGNAF
jgi:hypothetical protein